MTNLVRSLENQSAKSTERLLAERKPETHISKPVETEKPIKGNKLEVSFVIDEELQNDLEEIQVLLNKPLTKLELFKLMTQQTLEKLRKEKLKGKKIERQEHSLLSQTTSKRKAQPLRSQAVLKRNESELPESELALKRGNLEKVKNELVQKKREHTLARSEFALKRSKLG